MVDFRIEVNDFLQRLMTVTNDELPEFLSDHLTADTVWDIAHPVNRLVGVEAVLEGFILPLRQAIEHVRRRDELFIGGTNRRDYGGEWVASVTHYLGNFKSPLFGISPCDRLVFLRSGEFYRIENGRIAEAKLIVDFLDLMRQANCFPLPSMLGTEMLFPTPATHDGVFPSSNLASSVANLDLVEAMLADLHVYDPETFSSQGQTSKNGYWHDDMLWYGPGGIGSNYRWQGFEKDHRRSFLTAFPDRKGGDHYCRIGDANYVAVSGWPSMTMTHTGDYLGIKATGKSLTLRVMDFYRCATNKIMENWVLLDYIDLFQQMGVDLIKSAQTNKKQQFNNRDE